MAMFQALQATFRLSQFEAQSFFILSHLLQILPHLPPPPPPPPPSSRTPLDLELDLLTSQERLQRLHDEIRRLKHIKDKVEESKANG